MNLRTLIRRSLRFHWRAHLGVMLGAAVGSAVLIGALVVGDSVKESLRQRGLQRLGPINIAMESGDRMFQSDLAKRLLKWMSARRPAGDSEARYAGWILAATDLDAVAVTANGSARANHVNLFTSDTGFVIPFLPSSTSPLSKYADASGIELFINQRLADQLRVAPSSEILFRIRQPGAFSSDVAISQRRENSLVLRLPVTEVVAPADLGDFSTRARTAAPFNAFISSSAISRGSFPQNRANLVLSEVHLYEAAPIGFSHFRKLLGWVYSSFPSVRRLLEPEKAVSADELQIGLADVWRLSDLQTDLLLSDSGRGLELRTARVFFDPPIIRAALAANTNAQPVLTYLANTLRAGTNLTPYSMATAAGPPWTPADMRDDEILVSQWLADDLQVKPGDEIALSYFDPESGARLVERTNTFRVGGVVPMELPWADRTLMPDFPGIEKAESTHDWDAGFPLTYKIRQKDEDYWKEYRGTPKAFTTLAAGQKMWANRFGNLTAIRFPIPTNSAATQDDFGLRGQVGRDPAFALREKLSDTKTVQTTEAASQNATAPSPLRSAGTLQSVEDYRAALEKKILAKLKPDELGLRFEPVREQALKAAQESQDFGGLFLGFSFFLMAAALLLMALLFSLGLEQRAPEIGTLLALGFAPKQVRRLLLCEGVALSLMGGVLGALGGLAYAKAMLQGLTTIWRDAVGTTALGFHFTGQTLIIGMFASVVVSVIVIWFTLRKFVRRPARELLVGEIQEIESHVKSLKSTVVAIGALLIALGLVAWTVAKGDTANAGIFFGAGALVLVAGLAYVSAWLARKTGLVPVPDLAGGPNGDRRDACPTLASLGLRGCARRRKRSLSTIAMLSCGSFLIVSIGVFRLDADRDAWQRTSGTGGFALIGETTMPVVHDLNSQSGRDFFALSESDLSGVGFVPFRVREGDEASCLNLNRAQRPRLLGVKPEMLKGRFGFAKGANWTSLINTRLQPGEAAVKESENRLNGFSRPAPSNTGLKPGVNEIEIPAIGDANSIQWAMHKKVGDTIDYVDERGQPFKVRIVGAVANSILQGQLIIDEAEFVKRFPGESGCRMFLVDAPSNRVAHVSASLSRAMQDVGLELTPAAERLAQFNAVQNTYLGSFQLLGSLGLLLGSVGLGIVVLRNVLERRGELAVLLAVGFRKVTLQRLLLIENGALLATGLALGVVAAAVAVLPASLSPSAQLPVASLAVTLTAVLANGAVWTWAATRFALRGNLLEALRNE